MGSRNRINRRNFLHATSAMFGAAVSTGVDGRAHGFKSANDRPQVGFVGCGSRWDQRATIANGPHGLGKEFPKFADIVAVCDVDANRVGRAQTLVKDWLGQTPEGMGDYRKVIDNPDVDIATWGMGKTDTGPISVDPVMVEHPVEFRDGYPTVDDRYNTATRFNIKAVYDDDVELTIRHDTGNGILFEGTEGRIFVNRGRLTGKPVEDLVSNPLPDGALEEVYKNRPLVDHVTNFFEAVAARKEPISDVFSHHRALSTCHLAGIAARLGRKIEWDPKAERIVDDDQAQSLVSREKRQGYEIEM